MVATPLPDTRASDATAEQRVLIHGVSWGTYVMLRESLDEHGSSAVRLTYLEGALEIMSPSDAHEDSKTLLARLLEAYAEEEDLDLDGHGSTTFRAEAEMRGLEPDECYTLGRKKGVPDLAIEIVVSSPRIDKLDVYRGLGVAEVWVFREGRLAVHVLGARGYELRTRSKLLPRLDLELLVSFVRPEGSQTKLVKAFRTKLRSRPRRRARTTKSRA